MLAKANLQPQPLQTRHLGIKALCIHFKTDMVKRLGLGIGGFAAELTALAAASSPGETPIGSTVIALIFALSFYGVMILLGIGARDSVF